MYLLYFIALNEDSIDMLLESDMKEAVKNFHIIFFEQNNSTRNN